MSMSSSVTSVNSNILQQYFDFKDNQPPIDLLRLICSFLDSPKDIVHLGLANRRLTVLLSDVELWNSILHKHFSYAKLESKAEGPAFDERLTNIGHPIQSAKCFLQTFYGHLNDSHCMAIWNNKLIFISTDHQIEIWDLSTGQELQTLDTHQSPISCMTLWNDKLISGSTDGTIELWDLNTGEMLELLMEHHSSIKWMTMCGDQLIFSLGGATIVVSNLNIKQPNAMTSGYSGRISCMTTWNQKFIFGTTSSGENNAVRILDLNSERVSIFAYGSLSWSCMTRWNDKLISGTSDGRIIIQDLNTQVIFQASHLHQASIRFMTTLEDKLFSFSEDHTIKVWDLNTGQLLKELQNWVKSITLLNDGKLLFGSAEMITKILDFNHG
jgi:WD40 repeat protein